MLSIMPKAWTADSIGALARTFQPACVLLAGAELDVFTPLSSRPRSAAEMARLCQSDGRGMAVLLDALCALGLLKKSGPRYACAYGVGAASHALLPGLRHLANCLRRWAQLAGVVRSGHPAASSPSILGPAADQASFIGAMHSFAEPVADRVIAQARPGRFRVLLDVGGGSGTWTMAFLRRRAGARAILFDLPPVVALARQRLEAEGFLDRVRLACGDFYKDPMPKGADLAWVSAILHQNSRQENRRLFRKIHASLAPGGRVLIRDMVMDDSRTRPVSGALFAINMLVGTSQGGTFTFRELREDLRAAGFSGVQLVHRDTGMHSIVSAFADRGIRNKTSPRHAQKSARRAERARRP